MSGWDGIDWLIFGIVAMWAAVAAIWIVGAIVTRRAPEPDEHERGGIG